MTEIDVSDLVEITEEKGWFAITCICNMAFPYTDDFYIKETRQMWHCPHCGAKLYFRDAGEKRNRIVQVMDD